MLDGRRFLRCTIRVRGSETGEEKTMTSAMTAFGIAVGGTSLLYLLMTRLQNGKRNRGSSSDSSRSDGGPYAGGDGWTISSWFGERRFRVRQFVQFKRWRR